MIGLGSAGVAGLAVVASTVTTILSLRGQRENTSATLEAQRALVSMQETALRERTRGDAVQSQRAALYKTVIIWAEGMLGALSAMAPGQGKLPPAVWHIDPTTEADLDLYASDVVHTRFNALRAAPGTGRWIGICSFAACRLERTRRPHSIGGNHENAATRRSGGAAEGTRQGWRGCLQPDLGHSCRGSGRRARRVLRFLPTRSQLGPDVTASPPPPPPPLGEIEDAFCAISPARAPAQIWLNPIKVHIAHNGEVPVEGRPRVLLESGHSVASSPLSLRPRHHPRLGANPINAQTDLNDTVRTGRGNREPRSRGSTRREARTNGRPRPPHAATPPREPRTCAPTPTLRASHASASPRTQIVPGRIPLIPPEVLQLLDELRHRRAEGESCRAA